MGKVGFIYDESLKNYDFGKSHPFSGRRFSLFYEFFTNKFASYGEKWEIISPSPVNDDILQLVHSPEYIGVLKAASRKEKVKEIFSYVSGDNLDPLTGEIPFGIEEAARLIVGSSLLAGKLVMENRFSGAVGIGGGLHHAKRDYGEGFCFYNDVAILVEYLKRTYKLERIMVLDTDAHAGNGVKEIFYADPYVLFVDIHQDPSTLYPGSGFVEEIGQEKAKGFTVNIPLPRGSALDVYQYVFEEVILPLAEEFSPQFFIRYGGSDPHYLDELTDLGLTIDGFRMIGEYSRWIRKHCSQGRGVDLLASGYNLNVLSWAWSALIAGSWNWGVDFREFKEEFIPSLDRGYEEIKIIVKRLKRYLREYWDCMGE